MNIEELKYRQADDFFRDARDNHMAERVRDELRRENANMLITETEEYRRAEDWGRLAGQVVGAER